MIKVVGPGTDGRRGGERIARIVIPGHRVSHPINIKDHGAIGGRDGDMMPIGVSHAHGADHVVVIHPGQDGVAIGTHAKGIS